MPKIAKPKTSGVVVDSIEETIEPVMSPTESAEEVETKVEEAVKEESPINEVTVDANIIQKSPVKSVRILPRTDHTCVIGGVRYTLKKGVQQNVPLDVKNILTKADLLLPL